MGKGGKEVFSEEKELGSRGSHRLGLLVPKNSTVMKKVHSCGTLASLVLILLSYQKGRMFYPM